ncbi:enhancer of zeste 2 isoform a [Diplocarpon rosae]|nr:enhancer of zeste 2 isoform a [Diplocarpon rosae]
MASRNANRSAAADSLSNYIDLTMTSDEEEEEEEEEAVLKQKTIVIEDLDTPSPPPKPKLPTTFGNVHVQSQSVPQSVAASSSVPKASSSSALPGTSSGISKKGAIVAQYYSIAAPKALSQTIAPDSTVAKTICSSSSASHKLKAIENTPTKKRLKDLSFAPDIKNSPTFDPPFGPKFHSAELTSSSRHALKTQDSPRRKAKISSDSIKKAQENTADALSQSVPDEASRYVHLIEPSEDEEYQIEDHLPIQNPASGPGTQSTSSTNASPSTVGTNTPLITRLHQKNRSLEGRCIEQSSRRRVSPRDAMARLNKPNSRPEQIRFPELEKELQEFLQSMRDDHAIVTRAMIAKAQVGAQSVKPSFTDNISPFSSLISATLEPGQALPPSTSKEVIIQTSYQDGKPVKSKTTVIAKKLLPDDTSRVPSYSSYTNVRRNILIPDNEKLKFIPFIRDLSPSNETNDWKEFAGDLESAHDVAMNESSRNIETASRIRSVLDLWLEELDIGLEIRTLQQYVLMYTHILEDEEFLQRDLDQQALKTVLDSFMPLSEATKQAARLFVEAFENVIDVALLDVILPTGIIKEMIDVANKKPLPPSSRIETYTHYTCLICAAIDCPTHGDYSPDSSYPHPLSLSYEDLLRRFKSQIPKDVSGCGRLPKPCNNNCYLAIKHSVIDCEISDHNIAIIQEMLLVYKNPEMRACLIAATLNIPCLAVFAQIERIEREGLGDDCEERSSFTERPKKLEWYDNRRKVLKTDWMNMTRAHLHQERTQAVACGHAGPCINRPGDKKHSCTCAYHDILCESFCGCPDDCPRRFTGCSCASSGLNCASDTCICQKMNRECGPECVSCGAVERIDPVNKYDYELFTTGCQNVCLQRGVNKKTVIGQSQLVGFGLYLAEAVKKGDYLDEYNGENISSEEAERRGIIYHRKLLSFLFDLNRDRVIDAARLGNKTRFINHASTAEDGLNCEAKIVLVNGEHRIKFVALRDMNPGEELLFNYGKKFAETQDLAMTLPKTTGSKRGVWEGDDALDTLDGMNQRNRDTRAGLHAIRGGKKQGRGGKMRKEGKQAHEAVAVFVTQYPS